MTNILLAEDDAVVATDLALELEASGLGLTTVTSSVDGVLSRIEAGDVSFAVLNVSLQDGVIYPAARQLKALGIPFVFLTSFDKSEIDPEFRDVPHLSKPLETKTIADFVTGLVGTPTQAPRRRDGCGKTPAL